MQTKHLKTHALLLLMLFCGVQSFAQYNNIKWAPLKLTPLPLPSAFQIGYEHTMGDQISIGLTSKFYIPQSLNSRDITFETEGGSTTGSGNFKSGKFKGFALTPEFRYYTSMQNGAPNGFYLVPFLRYFKYGIDGDFVYRPENGEASSDIDAKLNLSGFGGGFGIGVQKIWDSGFLIDWNVGLGMTITGGRIKGTVDGPINDDIPAFIEEIAQAVSAIPLVNAKFTNEGDGLNARATGLPWPVIKTQLAIGYAF